MDLLVIAVNKSDKDHKIVNSLRGTHPLRIFGQVTFSNLGQCSKVTDLHCSTKITCVQISMLCIGAYWLLFLTFQITNCLFIIFHKKHF